MQADVVLKAVADKTRIRILAYLKNGPKFVEQVAMQLNISVSTASFHLEKLKAAGLVCDKKEQYYKTYRLKDGALELTLTDLVSEFSSGGADEFERIVSEEMRTPLNKLPVQKLKREFILRRISAALEDGKDYTEREMNIHIADFCDDFVIARREMVALGVIEHADGVYKKK